MSTRLLGSLLQLVLQLVGDTVSSGSGRSLLAHQTRVRGGGISRMRSEGSCTKACGTSRANSSSSSSITISTSAACLLIKVDIAISSMMRDGRSNVDIASATASVCSETSSLDQMTHISDEC